MIQFSNKHRIGELYIGSTSTYNDDFKITDLKIEIMELKIEDRIEKLEKELKELKKECGNKLPSMDEINQKALIGGDRLTIVNRKIEAFNSFLKASIYLNDEWEPDWGDDSEKYNIDYKCAEDRYDTGSNCYWKENFIVFRNKELIEKCHKIANHLEKELGYNFLDVLYKD